jgi:hypothetical protein
LPGSESLKATDLAEAGIYGGWNLWRLESVEAGIYGGCPYGISPGGGWNLWRLEFMEAGICGGWNLWRLESMEAVHLTEPEISIRH